MTNRRIQRQGKSWDIVDQKPSETHLSKTYERRVGIMSLKIPSKCGDRGDCGDRESVEAVEVWRPWRGGDRGEVRGV